jgi:hypothetical protein
MTCRQVVLALSSLIAGAAWAQGTLRSPTDSEAKVLARYTKTLETVLDQFRSDDWDESIDYALDGASVNADADVPLDVDALLERHYDVRQGSARWNAKLAPLIAQMQSKTTPEAMATVGQQMKRLQHVHVSVHFNVHNADVSPPPPGNGPLKIAGPALAYKVSNERFEDGTAYVLMFGRWQTAQWSADDGSYRFAFAHPKVTPFIENIEIRIYGAEDRLTELLRGIDWNKVNEALTP